MSRHFLRESVDQAALDAAGLIPAGADLSGPAQDGHMAGHDDLPQATRLFFCPDRL